MYHYHFLDITVKVLKCVCYRCGKLLIDRSDPRVVNLKTKEPKERWKEMYELCSKIPRCGKETEDGCGFDQPTRYKVDGIQGILAIWKDSKSGLYEEIKIITTTCKK